MFGSAASPPEKRPDETTPGENSKKESGESCDYSCGVAPWVQDLSDHVGYKLLVILFFVEHVMRGFVDALQTQGQSFIFAAYNVPAPTMSIYGGVVGLPWSMKPVVGLVSDIFPVAGYNKMPYMLMSSIVGAFSYIAIGFLPQAVLPVTLVVMCFFGMAFQESSCDILTEAKYAEKIMQVPAYGPHILTFVWFGMNCGGLIGQGSSGVLLSMFGAKSLYVVALIPAVIVIFPVWFNYLEESPVSAEQLKATRARFYKQKEACFLCMLMFLTCCALTCVGLLYSDPMTNCIVAGIMFVVILISFTVVLSPKIAGFNAWSFLQSCFSLSTGSGAFYFMIDSEAQYPEGPHFSPFFLTSVLGVTSSALGLLGIVTYQRYAKTWRYRNMLLIVNVVYGLLHMLDMIFYSRLNVKLGIPDHCFVLGTSVFSSILAQWQWMPQVILLSYLCPKGMEATMYSLLAGCYNLGLVVSANFSALLLQSFGVNPNGSVGESAQFENLWKVSFICSVLPMIPVIFLFRMVPDVAQGDAVIEPDEDATTGSMLNRWLGNSKDE